MSFWSRGLPAINGFMGFWKEPHPPHSYKQISSLQKPYPTLSFNNLLQWNYGRVEVKPLYVAPEDGKLIHRSQYGNDSSDEDEDESESEDEKITEKCKPETDVQAAIPTKSEAAAAAAATKPESSAKPKVTFVDPKKDESDDSDGSDEDDDDESSMDDLYKGTYGGVFKVVAHGVKGDLGSNVWIVRMVSESSHSLASPSEAPNTTEFETRNECISRKQGRKNSTLKPPVNPQQRSKYWEHCDKGSRKLHNGGKEAQNEEEQLQQIFNEVDKYLSNEIEKRSNQSFNYLEWWRGSEARYLVLSMIMKDIFAIPSSTVASESAFSLGKRVVDPFRSSLSPKW
ncbi:hypothetical protein OROMI_010764 [Orobanche minor]